MDTEAKNDAHVNMMRLINNNVKNYYQKTRPIKPLLKDDIDKNYSQKMAKNNYQKTRLIKTTIKCQTLNDKAD